MTDEARQHLAPSYRGDTPEAMTIEQKLDFEHRHAERKLRIVDLAKLAYHQARATGAKIAYEQPGNRKVVLPAKSKLDNAMASLYAEADTHHRKGGERLSAADLLKSMDADAPEPVPDRPKQAPYQFPTEEDEEEQT